MPFHKVFVLPKKVGFHSVLRQNKTDDIEQGFAFGIVGNYSLKVVERLASGLLSHPITDDFWVDDLVGMWHKTKFNLLVEVRTLPGVTDNLARTALDGLVGSLGEQFDPETKLYTSKIYCVQGAVSQRELREGLLPKWHNPLIHEFVVVLSSGLREAERGKTNPSLSFGKPALWVASKPSVPYEVVALPNDFEGLEALSERRFLALSGDEMLSIRSHYSSQKTQKERRLKTLPANDPTDVELEALAQTWSEHCKHKIFGATIDYAENNHKARKIHSIYNTYIKGVTAKLLKKRSDVLSVFSDNAGVFRFDDDFAVCVKVETHNSPCALEPYGGAMTGIVGVNRDIIGTGMGAKPIFNTDVFCFADPKNPVLRSACIPPKRMFSEVHRGIKDGGNQSGIPTINGAICFDESFLRRPLVFCGSGGLLPMPSKKQDTISKRINKGDLIAMVGGRIGKDGIHGATFSSKPLEGDSLVSAVQIGDPITQKKMTDYLLEARDKTLFRTLTDNGAGGLSSSVGELALLSNGCELHLDRAPLKYEGLRPWEILVSEAQERMTLAVPPEKRQALTKLARKHDVEVSFLGTFTNTGMFSVLHNNKQVAYLPLSFLHGGFPTLELKASWNEPARAKTFVKKHLAAVSSHFKAHYGGDYGLLLMDMLRRPNIASKEFWVRQYDHEVQGRTIGKPFAGPFQDAPMDAAVLRPVYDSNKGLVVACGINPKYSKEDCYWMAQSCVDEAFRNFVSVGGNPKTAVGLDNFCWPDPVHGKQNPNADKTLGQLVRCSKGLFDVCLAYGIPLISGKDSMKNDAWEDGKKHSILPTFLFTLVGTMPDINKAVTSHFKGMSLLGEEQESHLYVVGGTASELGGSELNNLFGLANNKPPEVDAKLHWKLFNAVYEAIQEGFVASCHDLSDGGFLVALAESAFGGMVGCDATLDELGRSSSLRPIELLYSESQGRFLVEIPASKVADFRTLFGRRRLANKIAFVGRTESQSTIPKRSLRVRVGGKLLLEAPLRKLKTAWKNALVF